MIKGIDVSRHNGVIDWNRVKQAGIGFAILRAGYGKSITQKDTLFEQNYAGAKAAGIPVGAYWYSYALTPAEAAAEAAVFLEAIKGKQFEYPVYFDIEERNALNTGKKNVSGLIRAFCTELEKAGYWCGVYSSRAQIESYVDEDTQKRFALWIAEWSSQLRYSGGGEAGIWQYSEKGRVDGIPGNVDLDIAYIDYPEMVRAAGRNGFGKTDAASSPTIRVIVELNGRRYEGDLTER